MQARSELGPRPGVVPTRLAVATVVAAAAIAIGVTVGMCTGWLTIGVEREWTWDIKPTGGAARLWIAACAFALFLASVLAVVHKLGQPAAQTRRSRWEDVLLLCVLVALGMGMQLGVGQLAKSGLHEWPTIVAVPWTNGYFDAALEVDDMGAFLRDYHEIMPQLNFHCRTHPPGAILLFWGINHLLESCPALTKLLSAALADSAFDPQALLAALGEGLGRRLTDSQAVAAWVASLGMALVCVAGCVPVFFMARQLFGRLAGFWAAAIYLVSPCVLYFTPALDQVVAAFCAAAGCLWVMALAGARSGESVGPRAAAQAFAAGLVISAGAFLSVSAGAFAGMLCLVWAAEWAAAKALRPPLFHLAVAACVGVAVFYVGVYAVTGHQCMPTFARILSVARENVRQQYIQRAVVFSYWRWLGWNLVEFFLGVGWAAAVCFAACFCCRQLRRRVLWVFIAALLLLDFSGTSMSETARLWMAFAAVPLVFAGGFVHGAGAWGPRVGAAVLVLSFAQAVALKLCFGWI